jgi:T4 gene 59 helicase, N terminal./T4 gene 59 helicase, C terminal.
MDAFTAYRYYLTLKTHFYKPTYDYFKYNKKLLGSRAAFEKRNDRYFFSKLAQQKSLPSFILSNVCINPYAVMDLVDNRECQQNFIRWQTYQQAMAYNLRQDLNKLDDSDKEFREQASALQSGQLPPLFHRFLSNEIQRESFCLILWYLRLVPTWDAHLQGNVIWETMRLPIVRYIPFVKKSPKYLALLDEKFPEKVYK